MNLVAKGKVGFHCFAVCLLFLTLLFFQDRVLAKKCEASAPSLTDVVPNESSFNSNNPSHRKLAQKKLNVLKVARSLAYSWVFHRKRNFKERSIHVEGFDIDLVETSRLMLEILEDKNTLKITRPGITFRFCKDRHVVAFVPHSREQGCYPIYFCNLGIYGRYSEKELAKIIIHELVHLVVTGDKGECKTDIVASAFVPQEYRSFFLEGHYCRREKKGSWQRP